MFLPIGRFSLSTFIGKLKAQGKHFMCLACLERREGILFLSQTDYSFLCQLSKNWGRESPQKSDFMICFLMGASSSTRK